MKIEDEFRSAGVMHMENRCLVCQGIDQLPYTRPQATVVLPDDWDNIESFTVIEPKEEEFYKIILERQKIDKPV